MSSAIGGPQKPTRVVAVVVSYNRRELLEKSLSALLGADRLPDALVVVDNASTDESPRYLRQLNPDVPYELVELGANTGGAGGFAVGMAHALAHHQPDLVWIMDDDTEVHSDTLSEAVKLWESTTPGSRPSLIASKVLWTDGREHPMNRPRTLFRASAELLNRWRKLNARPVRSASFVSLFINAERLRRCGLPVIDYFLWNDDFEFTTRLSRGAVALASDASVVSHHTKIFDSNTVDVGERFYFEVRNKLWMFTRSQSLSAGEKLLYGASSLRRWVRMIQRSAQRSVVIKAGIRGLKAALRAPRDNQQALAGIHDLPTWQLESSADKRVAPFSVLLPVYAGDNAQYFIRALQSVSKDQTLKPDQIVVVQDGPVADELAKALQSCSDVAGQPVELLVLEKSAGLAAALDRGLELCQHEFVARMDADDVSVPQRFELQLPYLQEGFSVVGSAIEEIAEDDSKPMAYRPVTTSPAGLAANTGFRSPFHHPSVMVNKTAVQAVGGYDQLQKMEDFWLWLRLLKSGYSGINLSEPLLRYRISAGAYQRRGGLELLKAELELQNRALRSGFISPGQWLRNVGIRAAYRMVPTNVRRRGYRAAFTRKEPLAG